jgi:hypothetical protein
VFNADYAPADSRGHDCDPFARTSAQPEPECSANSESETSDWLKKYAGIMLRTVERRRREQQPARGP